eukprot:10825401-Alexandrium_andersonii.AAC.1
MSASLVGSEMCIRDRSKGLRIGGLRIGACEVAIPRPRAPSRPAFVGGFGTVSYTHLTLPTICSV